ncbi:hypothetical protein DFH09DRAFT_1309486 [Mycena vulgaris]|nr:hypothetical protein DFH09DRAFT_1309486 [Mycena vulgaris]
MLLLFILVHLLTKNGSAVPIVLPLAPRTSINTCDDINSCRKLFDIVWGCLVTIFACTWVSVHPNVPPSNQSRLALLWRRLKMMLIGIIAPEVMVGFAARQFLGARMLSKVYGFSRTHGFIFCMGGFASSTGYPVGWLTQLKDRDLGPKFLKDIQKIRAEEIADKSKGDALSKGVALAQGLWFTTQCLARVHQHLAITELEVATLAFAVANVFIWLLWWGKPLHVQLPIIIGPPTPLDAPPRYPCRLPQLSRFVYAICGTFSEDKDDYDPGLSTSVPSFWSPTLDENFRLGTMGITALAGSVFGAIHCTVWTSDFPTTAEMWIWRSGSLIIAAIPVVTFLAFLCITIDETAFEKTKLGSIILIIWGFVYLGSIPIYIAARLILIALPLAALRSLPPSALTNVNWSTYIPHI